MIHKIEAKFKKKAMVSFAGANNLHALKKTFIHAVSTEDDINYFYLIEHPKGVLLCATTVSQFTGFDLTGVKFDLRYICVNETEINEVVTATTELTTAPITEKDTAEKQNEADSPGDRNANEIATISMPYYQYLAIMSALQTTHGMMMQHKAMILLQPDMTEETYNDQLKGNLDAQKTLQDSGI